MTNTVVPNRDAAIYCNSMLFSPIFIYGCRQTLKKPLGVNLTNMFMSSFYPCRYQKHKKTVKSSVSFCTLGSSCVKADHKILVKSSLGLTRDNKGLKIWTNGMEIMESWKVITFVFWSDF